jgi:hypothetical protein
MCLEIVNVIIAGAQHNAIEKKLAIIQKHCRYYNFRKSME